MRSLRLLLAVGLGLAPTLAAAAAGTNPAFAGGGAGMSLTATMDGQDQRLLAGTKHTVHITLADTPGEADLRDIDITLQDLDPQPLPVACDGPGENGHLSLEPNQELHCTAVVTARVGYRTLVARATATVPGSGSLARTAPLHYDGFMPPPPPPPTPEHAAPLPAHAPLAPDPAAGQPRPVVSPPPPPHFDPPAPVDPPRMPGSGAGTGPVKGPDGGDCSGDAGAGGSGGADECCSDSAAGSSAADGCCSDPAAGSSAANGCCSGAAAGPSAAKGCCDDAKAGGAMHGGKCCGSADKSGSCTKHEGGLAFTGMSAPMLTAAGAGGLLFVAGGFVLFRKFARR